MNILAISGSASANSGNFYLLEAIAEILKDKHKVDVYQGLYDFKLFSPDALKTEIPQNVQSLKNKIKAADAIIISTPEYTHNIPAVLKNLIDWCTASGEFSGKKTVLITYTPFAPRGEYAMKSLLPSIQILEANCMAQIPLYKTDVTILDKELEFKIETKEKLMMVFDILS